MILMELFRERVLRQPPRRSIPTMDGPWRPNDRLEECARLPFDIPEPTGLAWASDERLFIASKKSIFLARGPKYDSVTKVADFSGKVRALGWHPKLELVAAVTGEGTVIGADQPQPNRLTETDGQPLRHPTALAVVDDGALYVTEGSKRFAGEDWVRDLMLKGADGRLVRYAPGETRGQTISDNLAFPSGVGMDAKGIPVVSEAWCHRLVRIASGKPEIIIDNLPGYPGALLRDRDGWWLSLFAPRSHIVEFVLEEDDFRKRMVEHIDPRFWISPSTDPREHHFQPVQVGSLRSQNIKKSWAPARSYGLVVRLDDNFEAQASYHSRSNGTRHGIGALALSRQTLFAASQGANTILLPMIKRD